MRLLISVGVPWNIFGIQGWLVPEKCILEAFGTGVPNGNVTAIHLTLHDKVKCWTVYFFTHGTVPV